MLQFFASYYIHPVYMPTAIQYHPEKPPESCSPTLNPVADTSQTFVSPGSQRLCVSSVTTDRQFCEKLIGKLTCTLDPFLSWFPPCLPSYSDIPAVVRNPRTGINCTSSIKAMVIFFCYICKVNVVTLWKDARDRKPCYRKRNGIRC